MSYARNASASSRVGITIAVGALHGLALVAVINGLSVAFIPVDNPPPISATNTPLDANPPPTPPAPRSTSLPHDPAPAPTEEVRIDLGTEPIGPFTLPNPGIGVIADPLPQPRVTPPALTARTARPLGSRAGWVTDADYPSHELRLSQSGAVGFTLAIDAAGRVGSCTVTRTSGFAGLDETTCRLIARRARFEPARDDRGLAVPGTYIGTVRWQIPD
jgi:protein TonB